MEKKLFVEKEMFKIYEKYKHILREYLRENGLRNTPERYQILDEVIAVGEAVDAESIYLSLIRKKYRVSKATVYNSLVVFEKSKIVRKIFSGSKHMALYYLAEEERENRYAICSTCGTTIPVDLEISCGHVIQLGQSLRPVRFHSINFYVDCLTPENNCNYNKV